MGWRWRWRWRAFSLRTLRMCRLRAGVPVADTTHWECRACFLHAAKLEAISSPAPCSVLCSLGQLPLWFYILPQSLWFYTKALSLLAPALVALFFKHQGAFAHLHTPRGALGVLEGRAPGAPKGQRQNCEAKESNVKRMPTKAPGTCIRE
jgi:hypothetical protein